MRSNYTNSVNVQNDRIDRVNVMVTLRGDLQHLRLLPRKACEAIAASCGKAPRFQAMSTGIAGSPSLGDHRWPGGPGWLGN